MTSPQLHRMAFSRIGACTLLAEPYKVLLAGVAHDASLDIFLACKNPCFVVNYKVKLFLHNVLAVALKLRYMYNMPRLALFMICMILTSSFASVEAARYSKGSSLFCALLHCSFVMT